VHTMLKSNHAHAMKIFVGDVIPNKKPHPAIYELAVATLNAWLDQCVVNEDSQVRLATTKAASMACTVTTSEYTEREGFAIADTIFSCINEHPHQHFDVSFELVAGKRPNCMIDIWMMLT
jgi:beta-phosphoglucomutase-like phosphatase (HAD superfamily)